MVLIGLIVVVIEASEHITTGESILNSHFLMEVITYGIAVPIIGIILVNWLTRVEAQRDRVEFELGKLKEFNDGLRNASTWEEVVESVIQFPQFVLPPVINTCLTVYDVDSENFKPVASWSANGNRQTDINEQVCIDACQSCILSTQVAGGNLHQCTHFGDSDDRLSLMRYCLPLSYRNYLSGLLIFDMPAEQQVSDQQLSILQKLTPELALAVDYSHLNSQVIDQRDATLVERRRIARDLHDTLGQNISFLRLKLDQISDRDPLLGIAEFQDDLERMRSVADEAYEQMRGTLANLHPDSQILLEDALRSLAKKVAERANFKIAWNTQGTPTAIRPHTNRQILYICRETMNNIEKHAQAEQVSIDLLWEKDDLTITITDDGCGFNPNASLRKQNLGLTIMAERAVDINAQLMIDSVLGQGSTISLKVPVETKKPEPVY